MDLWIWIVVGALALVGAAYIVGGIWNARRSWKLLRLWPRSSRRERLWGAVGAFALWIYFLGFADGYEQARSRRRR